MINFCRCKVRVWRLGKTDKDEFFLDWGCR